MAEPPKSAVVGASRRKWIASTASATAALILPSSSKATEDALPPNFKTFEDKNCKFKVSVPADWEETEQELPDRRRIDFFLEPTTKLSTDPREKILIFIAFTPIRDDFTGLGAFGGPEQVARSLIPKPTASNEENLQTKLISAETKGNTYVIDYFVSADNTGETHYRVIFTIAKGATGGAGSILVTLSAQAPESRYKEIKPVFDEIIDSFSLK